MWVHQGVQIARFTLPERADHHNANSTRANRPIQESSLQQRSMQWPGALNPAQRFLLGLMTNRRNKTPNVTPPAAAEPRTLAR